jgi:nitrite reductase/ring-hydroxylating ferredoxin subunit
VEEEPLLVKVGPYTIQGSYLVVATHNPLVGCANAIAATILQTKLFLYTTYAVGTRLAEADVPEGCFWDTDVPYHHLRVDRHSGFAYAIFGGEDHKTGQTAATLGAYQRLESKLGRLFSAARVDSHWSGQVIETADGLPYIGLVADRQFAATGFAGNGMTFGTLGAMMAFDAFEQRHNSWEKIFNPHRTVLKGGIGDYLRENADFPTHLIRGWLIEAGKDRVAKIEPNSGTVLRCHGRPLAIHRKMDGHLSICSAVCTHLKCVVSWNDAEKTWDCPCHGSRFDEDGKPLSGPAKEPLTRVEIPAE